MTRQQFVEAVAADADGHGLRNLTIPFKASFTYDVPGTKLRFCFVGMASETGGDEGLLRRAQMQAFLIPALQAALQEGKWVILASHHGLGYLGDGSMATKEARAEAVPSAELLTLFRNYGNIIASITGHSHEHVVN